MRIVRKKLEVASLILVSGILGQSALGQSFGQVQPQQQGGLGTGTGNPSALGLGDITFANNDGTFQNGTPGSFGGPGISGAPLIEFATKNATQGFSANGAPTGSTSAGGRTGGIQQNGIERRRLESHGIADANLCLKTEPLEIGGQTF